MLATLGSDGVSPELANLIARAQALNDDFELTAVRSWKQAEPGRKAIGHMPIYVPRELIHAAGMLPVGIVGAGERLEIIRGDAYFQSYICHIPRSTIELALSRPAGCAGRHAVSLDLRCHPQLVRHVEHAASRTLRPLHGFAAELRSATPEALTGVVNSRPCAKTSGA